MNFLKGALNMKEQTKIKIRILFNKILRKITKQRMVIDITGIRLTPGCGGMGCPGNGAHFDLSGKPIECCCDGCDYYMCCYVGRDLYEAYDPYDDYSKDRCRLCNDKNCPRVDKPYPLY